MNDSQKTFPLQRLFRKLIPLVFTFCVLVSCNDEELQDKNPDNIKTVTFELSVDEGNALKIKKTGNYEIPESEAINMVRQMYMNDILTKAGKNYIIKSCKKAPLQNVQTKSTNSPGYYVIEFTDGTNNGFSLASADRRLPEVFAYTENGAINDTTYNNGLKMFCQLLPGYIADKTEKFNTDSLYEAALARFTATKSGWIDDGNIHYLYMLNGFMPDPDYEYMGETTEYNPFETIRTLKTKWHQTYPYNEKLPLIAPYQPAYVGCTIVAVLQVMAYHKKPYGNITTEDWTRFTRTSQCGEVKLQDCVKSVFDAIPKSKVDATGTGVYRWDEAPFLRANGFTVDYMESYDFSKFPAALRDGPTIMSGTRDADGRGGHTWVIDGTRTSRYMTYDKYEKDDGYDIWRIFVLKREEIGPYYVQCNWGYGDNSGDGWYRSGVFEYKPATGGGFSYLYNLAMYTKMQP